MSNPYLMRVPFCNSGANKNTIQVSRQPTQPPQDATYEEGFPTVTMVPTGGIAPNGQDMNGILNEISSAIVHYCRGDRIQFDAAYAAAIGGYNKGAILASNDYQKDYISLVDNNTADPNGSNTTWAVYAGQGSVPVATSTTTGTVKLVNSLASTATDAALTANQGKVLGDRTQQATTTNVGISRFADALEVANRSNSNVAINPSNASTIAQSTDLGVGQSWQNVTSGRSIGVTYTNNTTKPIQVMIVVSGGPSSGGNSLVINGVTVATFDVHSSMTAPFSFIVPAGHTYRINVSSTIASWSELR